MPVLVSRPGLGDCRVVSVGVLGCVSAVLDLVAGSKVDPGVVGLVEFVAVVVGGVAAQSIVGLVGVLVVVVEAAVAWPVEAFLVDFCGLGVSSYTCG